MRFTFFTFLTASFLKVASCLYADTNFEMIDDKADLTILTPSLSGRQTAKLRLDNGLSAYLISDPGIEQSAAALAVNIGSWDDPEQYPGMAHFLEHMLFMGTKAYPGEDEYMQYIFDNSGKVNAYTSTDRTVYMFSVTNDAFASALDRFSHFFIDPLFKQASINRELHAVDQEHAKNIENDGWRQWMVFKETGNPNHPIVKFSTGNAETLGGIPRDDMKDWYEKHYSSKKMHLVIYSALPIDELIKLTKNDFSSVPNRVLEPELIPDEMTSNSQKGKIIYIKPIKDLKTVSLSWEIPSDLASNQETKAGQLIAYVLKSGSKNSLLAYLKKQHLAEKLDVSYENLSIDSQIFSIEISLTDKGIENVDQVIKCCYEALARLKRTGVPQYIFDEVQKVATIDYEYQSRTDAFEYVQKTVHKLVDEDLETFPKKTLIPIKYDPEIIQRYLGILSPENCIYFVTADPSITHVPPTKSEKWMDVEYSIVKVSDKQLLSFSSAGVNPQIGLPPPNPYIPDTLSLVSSTESDATIIPKLINNDSYSKVYYAEDHRYFVPKISYVFRLKTPELDGSPKAKAFTDLYLRALEDKLFPILSSAGVAGLSLVASQENLGLLFAINGFSDKSEKFTSEIFSQLSKVKPSKEQFEIYKQSVKSSYENRSKELPVSQSLEVLSSILFNNSPTSSEKLNALDQISYQDFLKLNTKFFQKVYVEAVLYGNIEEKEAQSLVKKSFLKLKKEVFPENERERRQVLILNKDQGPFMLVETTPMQGNAAVLVIEQGGYDFKRRGAQQLLGMVLRQAFFNTLRTKQQTGYIAKAWDKEDEWQLFQYFAVQSSTHQPGELIARFELFLENFLKNFETTLSPERFNNVKKMLISLLNMPPENLQLMGARLFLLGFDYNADFELVKKRISALETLTYEELETMANEFLSRSNSRRIAILMEGSTQQEKDFRYEVVSKEDLRHQGVFVAWK